MTPPDDLTLATLGEPAPHRGWRERLVAEVQALITRLREQAEKTPTLRDLHREAADALEQAEAQERKGQRVFEAVVFAYEKGEVPPSDLATHGMVRRAVRFRGQAEAEAVRLRDEWQHAQAEIDRLQGIEAEAVRLRAANVRLQTALAADPLDQSAEIERLRAALEDAEGIAERTLSYRLVRAPRRPCSP